MLIVPIPVAHPVSDFGLTHLSKVELAFVGHLAFETALMSDALSLAEKGTAPKKEWCQLGALKDKLAVQVQLVQSTEGGGFHIADAYSSTPAPQGVP